MNQESNQADSLPPKGKIVTAGIIFAAGFLSPLLIPVVTSSDLSIGWKTSLSGLLALGIPELFMLIATAVAGKEGFNYIKSKVFGFLNKHGPPDTVSNTRYKIGLVLFVFPILAGWLIPYFSNMIPSYEENRMIINIIGDIILATSLFVLGGDFWDKLRSLFIYGTRVVLPENKL
ncbi:MAG: hypothetical protein KJN64_10250 [Ignavibacteria bacterium]|nr:hypothetical protein [Ignavibacteria bacterium]MBT8383903.1 hypothetical protein [Ignavibacteria bacterium]NNL22281.1 hypothetical protein [Ignavibacteriaceae bacterium]